MARHGFHVIIQHNLKKEQYLAIAFLLMANSLSWAFPLPGSQITNIASGDFADEQGNVQIVDSNPVSLTIQKVLALELNQDQQQIGNIGAKLNFPHLLTNSGNSADEYQLSLTQATDDNFDLTDVAVYADRDQNGLPDDNVNLLAGGTVKLEAGRSLALVVAGSIPVTVTPGQQARFILRATSNENNALIKTVNDTATVVDDAVLQVTKAQSISAGIGNTEITYTLTYTNTGTAAGKLLVKDTLNSALQYKAGSALWSNGSGALTDANDGNETGANNGLNYRVLSGNQIEFEIASIPALTTGSVSFKVQVADTAVDTIANTAIYTQYDSGNAIKKNTQTNTVIYINQHNLGVVANNKAASASNAGNPNSAPDNLTVIASAVAGQEVLFDNYIWNTGETTDIYNLTVSTSNLPACARVKIYASDGKTMLVDSNGDGVIDTGTIAQGSVKHIKVGVYSTPDCTASTPILLDLLARSVTNVNTNDAVRNQLNAINPAGITDLYNSDNTGVGVGNVDNGGNAWISKTIASGGKAVFPLVINNTANTANNYTLYASATVINLNNLSNISLPAGWSVSFYEGDATCTTLGNQITNSGSVAANSTKQYCAIVQVSTSVNNTTLPIWFAIKSAANQQGDVVKNEVKVQAVRNLNLLTDQQGQVQIGGSIVYLHTLKNLGTVQEGTAAGQVKLEAIPANTNDGFTYTLYYDANQNGQLDSADIIATDLATITGNNGLAPNQSIQLLLKVQAPTTATNGMSSQANLTITPLGTIQGLNAAIAKNTDITTVGVNQLRLVKSQVKDETCSATTFNTLTYSTVPVQVKPNQCVVYRLTVRNESASSVNAVVIQDVVPVYTTLKNAPPPSSSQGSVTVTGDQIRADIGTVASSQSAYLYFSIRVNP